MKTNYTISLIILTLLFAIFSLPANAFLFRSKIDSIKVEYDYSQLVLPGESFNISVTAFHKNGKVRKTKGILGGTVGWWRYKIEVQGGSNSGGKIRVNEQLVPSKGKYVSVKVILKKQAELAQLILIPLNYETQLDYQPTSSFDKAPGCIVKGELIAKYDNGEERIYKNLQRNKEANRFRFSTKDGYWKKGRFIIEPNFHKITNHHSALIVNSIQNEALSDTFDILLDYKHNYRLSDYGSSGFDGSSGMNGHSGSTGCNGSRGQNGQYGEHGENAADIGVWVDSYYDPILEYYLLYVYAENQWTGKEYRYLINPNGGKLDISSIGGKGGDGGHGGRGGHGGKGEDGRIWYETKTIKKIVRKPFQRTVIKKEKKKIINSEGKEEEIEVERTVTETYYKNVEVTETIQLKKQGPGGDGGNGGAGGNGGFAGFGGNGGDIHLYFTDDAWTYQDQFITHNYGGRGGQHGVAGQGGAGGQGGSGSIPGRRGCDGSDGGSPMGWSENGYNGQVTIESCDDFVGNTAGGKLSQAH